MSTKIETFGFVNTLRSEVSTQTCVTSLVDEVWIPLSFVVTRSPFGTLASFSFALQMLQLQFIKVWIPVPRMTSRKGTMRQNINQMSIIFMSELGGSSSILLVKMVVITSMIVRFTAMASPKRSKKMVVKVMRSRRMVVDRWSPALWTPSSSASEP